MIQVNLSILWYIYLAKIYYILNIFDTWYIKPGEINVILNIFWNVMPL